MTGMCYTPGDLGVGGDEDGVSYVSYRWDTGGMMLPNSAVRRRVTVVRHLIAAQVPVQRRRTTLPSTRRGFTGAAFTVNSPNSGCSHDFGAPLRRSCGGDLRWCYRGPPRMRPRPNSSLTVVWWRTFRTRGESPTSERQAV